MKRSSLLGISIVAITLSACQSTPTEATPEVVTFAQCLTEKGATFYGTERCQFCKQQKALFSTAMTEIKFVDCDQNKLACKGAGVASYPTRVLADGSSLGGVQTFEQLSAATSCPVPANR